MTGASLFGAFLVLYVVTAARTVIAGDGPELTVAALRLGIPHPSGYPTFTLLGRLFTLLPLGSVAFRMNFFAAVAGAAAVGFLGAWLRRVTGSLLASVLAASAFGVSFTLWRESTSAEVYALSALFLALLLRLLPEEGEPRKVLLSSYVWGLALTNHLALGFLLPAFAMHGLRAARPNRRLLLGAAALFFLGLTAYIYLPVRAAQSPPWNWGDPSTLDRFLFHVFGRGYWGYLGEGGSFGRVADWLGRLGGELTLLVWIAVPVGAWVLRRERRDLLLLVAGGSLLSLGYTFHFHINDPDAYFMPVHLLLTIPIAFALREAARRRRTLTGVAAAALILFQASRALPRAPFDDGSVLAEYVSNLLVSFEGTDGDPVVIVEGDAETFGLLYAIEGEGRGRDLSLWNPLLDAARDGPALTRLGRGALRGPGWRRQAIRYGVGSGVPVFAVAESDEIRAEGYGLAPWGIVYRYVPDGAAPPAGAGDLWERYHTERASSVDARSGYLDRILAATYPIQEARYRLTIGDREGAYRKVDEAAAIGDGIAPVQNNVGLAYERAGDFERAREAYGRAERLSSDRLPTWNLARLDAEEGRDEDAERRYREVIERDPRLRFSARLSLAELLLDEGRRDEAEDLFAAARLERPGEAAPLFGLGRCAALDGDFAAARESFRRAERLRPGLGRLGEYFIADEMARRGLVEEAAGVYVTLAGDPPTDLEALRSLARLREETGRAAAADSIFAVARRAAPNDPETMNAEAWTLAESGRDLGRALDLARAARRIAPDDPSYADTEGWALYRAGEYAEAAEVLERAVRLGLEGAGVRYRLGLALVRAGRAPEGRAFLEGALAAEPASPYAEEARRLVGDGGAGGR